VPSVTNPTGRRGKDIPVPSREEVLKRLWKVAKNPGKNGMIVVAACKSLLEELPKGPGVAPVLDWADDDGDVPPKEGTVIPFARAEGSE
jgi:hypothetical protein